MTKNWSIQVDAAKPGASPPRNPAEAPEGLLGGLPDGGYRVSLEQVRRRLREARRAQKQD
jgi:hypothetical protein